MTVLVYPEKSRTYHFPDGHTTVIYNVVAFAAPKGRSHRLETGDGRKHIVPPGWLRIELDVDSWSF